MGGSPRVPRHKAARSTPCFRRGRGAQGTEVGRDQEDPGLGPGASPSPCSWCPEGLACPSTCFLCAQAPPLPKPGAPASCVCEGAGGRSQSLIWSEGVEEENVVRGYLGEGGEYKEGSGAFASKDPLAPSSQHFLFPPRTRLLKRKIQGCVSKPPPDLQEECLVLGRRETPGKREAESAGCFGADRGLATQASLRWGGRQRGGEQLGGTLPHLP